VIFRSLSAHDGDGDDTTREKVEKRFFSTAQQQTQSERSQRERQREEQTFQIFIIINYVRGIFMSKFY